MSRDCAGLFLVASFLLTGAACGSGGGGSDTPKTDAGPDSVTLTDSLDMDTPTKADVPDAGNPTDPGSDTPVVKPDAPLDIVHPDVCANECPGVDVRECIAEAPGNYRVCQAGVDGCLDWGAPQVCPQGNACVDGECAATCTSAPGCTAAGDRRCAGSNSWQECVEAAPGCFTYGPVKECPGSMACGASAKCECLDDCGTEGLRRCFSAGSGKEFQVCAKNENDCMLWSTPTTCPGGGDCAGDGVCQASCVSDPGCSEAGQKRCASSSALQECAEVEPGCFQWGGPQACPGLLTCTDGTCQAQCVSDAGCTAAGVLSCLDTGHERACAEVEPGCFKWGEPSACQPHEVCGAGGCACEAPCKAGATECVAGDARYRRFCNQDTAGCTYWVWEDCGVAAECKAGACTSKCQSDPSCTAVGVTVCETLTSFAACAEVEPGCVRRGAPVACGAHQACDAATGKCACAPAAGCDGDGKKECVDWSHFRQCGTDNGGCLYWGAPVACGTDTSCTGGVCESTCETDPDCTTAGLKRCTAAGLEQVCGEVPGAAGCRKWGVAQACPVRQACLGTPGCTCAIPCQAGQVHCVGVGHFQTCETVVDDPDGCREWTSPEACAEGLSCAADACRKVVSPEATCTQITLRLVDQGYASVRAYSASNGSTSWTYSPMALADGIWSVSLPNPDPGVFEYKFVADGTWMRDPLNPDWTGYPPFDNSLVLVPVTGDCEIGSITCVPPGSGTSVRKECVADAQGCTRLVDAAVQCAPADEYCHAGQCLHIDSPVVTAATVTFRTRASSSEISVAGDFTTPPWEVRVPLVGTGEIVMNTLDRNDYKFQGLTEGQHQYKFVQSDDVWFYDPANPEKVEDGLGGYNSLFVMPKACATWCKVGYVCQGKTAQSECTMGSDGCPSVSAPIACPAFQHCIRSKCERFPVVDPATKQVTFLFEVPGQDTVKVQVAGSFTTPAWNLDAAPKMYTLNGIFWIATSEPLAPGTYQYKYVHTRTGVAPEWVTDPLNPETIDDGSGNFNSQFVVP